jgi:hypothetical protein
MEINPELRFGPAHVPQRRGGLPGGTPSGTHGATGCASSTDPGQIGWAHNADATPAGPSVSFQAVLEFSMEAMLLETTHVWNTPGKGFFLRERVVIKSVDFDSRFPAAKCVLSLKIS